MRFTRTFLVAALLAGLVPVIAGAQNNPAITNDLYNNPSSPAFGNSNATVIIDEFYDYRCSYCKASEAGLEQLLQEDRNVKIIYKDFPKLGPLSQTAAIATLASTLQGMDKYIRFHNMLMSKDFPLASEDTLYQAAAAVGLDVDRLKQDMNNGAITALIQDNIALGRAVGVTVTPTFVVNGHVYAGYADYNQLKKYVDYARATGGRR